MVVSGIISGGVFCQDMDDIVVSGVSGELQVEFSIRNAAETVLNSFLETYYPDGGGKVRITGLAELMEAYLDGVPLQELYRPHQEYTEVDGFVVLSMAFYQDGSLVDTCSQTVYQANNRVNERPSSYRYFLSRFRERTVFVEHVLSVSYIFRGQELRAGVAYMQENGRSAYRVLSLNNGGMTEGKVCVHQYVPSDLADRCGVDVEQLLYVDFELGRSSGNRFAQFDKMRCTFDHGNHLERTAFVFKNLFGVLETLVMTGQNKRTSELEATFSWIGRKYRKTSTDLTTSHTVCTGYIDDVTHASVKDAIRSTEVYLLDGLELGDQVTVTDIDLDYAMPRTSPLAAYLTYRVSEKVQERFSRVAVRESEIFDDTFDDTFE
ncbi:MAG: hypothetical protein IJV06_08190 [Bacteroidaceae bacterium]|nr:hypothetical protein [Bacteroidaceae bacterium]